MKTGNFISIDFETATNDREPCQLGIAVVRNWDIVQKMSYLIQPKDNRFDANCSNIHGMTEIHTKNAPSFSEVWSKTRKYFNNAIVVMHNVGFDADVLTKAINNSNLEHPVCGLVCTYNLTGLKLETACEKYDIPFPFHHDAMFDAEATAKLYIKLNNGEIAPIAPKQISKKRDYSKYDKTQAKADFELFDDELRVVGVKECEMFKGKRFLITGAFERNREYLKATIKALGGLNSNSVTKSLSYAVLGESPGPSKTLNIEQFIIEGLPINKIDESTLLEMIKSSLEKQGLNIEELSYY